MPYPLKPKLFKFISGCSIVLFVSRAHRTVLDAQGTISNLKLAYGLDPRAAPACRRLLASGVHCIFSEANSIV